MRPAGTADEKDAKLQSAGDQERWANRRKIATPRRARVATTTNLVEEEFAGADNVEETNSTVSTQPPASALQTGQTPSLSFDAFERIAELNSV
eukprot:4104889-Pyramimonas_sp.AAC.1